MRRVVSFSLLAGFGSLLAGCAVEGPAVAPTPATPVFFQQWSAALDNLALATVATAAKEANAAPTAMVYVTGAADTVGGSKANVYLSETRAQVVADQLAADGVDRTRIHIHAIGEVAAPAQPNETPAQFSRRATIQIGG